VAQHLRTVDGVLCSTYREACQRLGLLENDTHWEDVLIPRITLIPNDMPFDFQRL